MIPKQKTVKKRGKQTIAYVTLLVGDSVRDSPRALAGVALGEEAGGSLGAEEDEGLHVTTDEALPESRLDLEATEAASLGPM